MKIVCIKNDIKPLKYNTFSYSHSICDVDLEKKTLKRVLVYETMFYEN